MGIVLPGIIYYEKRVNAWIQEGNEDKAPTPNNLALGKDDDD